MQTHDANLGQEGPMQDGPASSKLGRRRLCGSSLWKVLRTYARSDSKSMQLDGAMHSFCWHPFLECGDLSRLGLIYYEEVGETARWEYLSVISQRFGH